MKYLVQQIENYDTGEVTFKIEGTTNARHLPRGGKHLLLSGVETQYPKVSVGTDGLEVVEDVDLKDKTLRKINRKAKGKIARRVCEEVLDMVSGYNVENDFTADQITQMELDFKDVVALLRANRPNTAKIFIQNLTVNEVVTQELKDDILEEMEGF
jgi:hypothetical protein